MGQDDLDIDLGPALRPKRVEGPAPDRRPDCLCRAVGRADAGSPRIFLHAAALADIEAHCRTDNTRELGGLLMGRIAIEPPVSDTFSRPVSDTFSRSGEKVSDTLSENAPEPPAPPAPRPYVEILQAIPAPAADSTGVSIRFTHRSWRALEAEQERRCPELRRVGWYHSHPGFGILLSRSDVAIHTEWFGDPGQVAYVFDPILDRRGFFRWEAGQLRAARGFTLFCRRQEAGLLEKLGGAVALAPAAADGQPPCPIDLAALHAVRVKPHIAPGKLPHCVCRWHGGPDTTRPRIFASLAAMVKLDRHAAGDLARMQGGMLMGLADTDEDGLYVAILDALPARFVRNDAQTITFTRQCWEDLYQRIARQCPDLGFVGWYHTNLGYGVYLSRPDVRIHTQYFNRPGDVAYVCDPILRRRAYFRWADGRIAAARGFALFADRRDEQLLVEYVRSIESRTKE